MSNTAIWDALAKTDPKHTKPFTRAGGFKGTATKPIYHSKRMTEMFGPCGSGWGYTEPTYQVVNGADGEVAVYCWLSLWYIDPKTGERSQSIPGVGGDFVVKKIKDRLVTDDEAFKKAKTDAEGNAMKELGMSADIHMGMFDDSKYLSGLVREFSDAADAPNSQNQYPAPKNAGAPEEWVRKAIGEMERLATLKALGNWWAANQGHIKSLPEDQQAKITEAKDRRKDELSSPDAMPSHMQPGTPDPEALTGKAA